VNPQSRLIDHLIPALQWLDHRLARAVSVARQAYGPEAEKDPFRGLHLGPADVERMLAQQPGAPLLWSNEEDSTGFDAVLNNTILSWLSHLFGLDVFDLALLLIALAPEIDLRYERLYSYLQDDVSRRRPTVDLALNLLCASAGEKLAGRRHFAPDAPLMRYDILTLTSTEYGSSLTSLLSRSMKLDDTIASLLLGGEELDQHLSGFCAIIEPEISMDELPLRVDRAKGLVRLAKMTVETAQALRLYVRGPQGAGQRLAAHALAKELETTLMTVDLGVALAVDPGLTWAPQRIFRQQILLGSVVYIDGCDQLAGAEWRPARLRLQKALAESSGVTVLSGETAWPAGEAGPMDLFNLSIDLPSYRERRAWWERELAGTELALDEDNLDQLAGRFKFSPEQISQAVQAASVSAGWQVAGAAFAESKLALGLDDLFAVARAQSSLSLGSLAAKIEARCTWRDIVLPEDSLTQLREICQQVTHRHRVMNEWGFDSKLSLGKGITALFAGPSGTGKTMAAEIIANDLRLDLYKIDLSGVVSKYIGETEKNLDQIFRAATNANAILFFDEADALFGKRSEVHDAHDRYANIEISFLLQRMETYEGLAILATNLRQNLDESFIRRMAFSVHFPFPDESSRLLIWQGVWPAQTPLTMDLDLEYLARQFKLSGGNIKNVALASAFLASANGGAVTMEHILHATRREYQKMGKVLSAAELYGTGSEAALAERNQR
jgi:hypothetical protein